MRRQKLRRRMHDMTCDDSAINDRFCGAIWTIWGPFRNAAEWIARAVSGDPRAAQNWLYRKNAPSLAKALRLMAENDAFRREVDKLIDELKDENAKASRGSSLKDGAVLPQAGGTIGSNVASNFNVVRQLGETVDVTERAA